MRMLKASAFIVAGLSGVLGMKGVTLTFQEKRLMRDHALEKGIITSKFIKDGDLLKAMQNSPEGRKYLSKHDFLPAKGKPVPETKAEKGSAYTRSTSKWGSRTAKAQPDAKKVGGRWSPAQTASSRAGWARTSSPPRAARKAPSRPAPKAATSVPSWVRPNRGQPSSRTTPTVQSIEEELRDGLSVAHLRKIAFHFGIIDSVTTREFKGYLVPRIAKRLLANDQSVEDIIKIVPRPKKKATVNAVGSNKPALDRTYKQMQQEKNDPRIARELQREVASSAYRKNHSPPRRMPPKRATAPRRTVPQAPARPGADSNRLSDIRKKLEKLKMSELKKIKEAAGAKTGFRYDDLLEGTVNHICENNIPDSWIDANIRTLKGSRKKSATAKVRQVPAGYKKKKAHEITCPTTGIMMGVDKPRQPAYKLILRDLFNPKKRTPDIRSLLDIPPFTQVYFAKKGDDPNMIKDLWLNGTNMMMVVEHLLTKTPTGDPRRGLVPEVYRRRFEDGDRDGAYEAIGNDFRAIWEAEFERMRPHGY